MKRKYVKHFFLLMSLSLCIFSSDIDFNSEYRKNTQIVKESAINLPKIDRFPSPLDISYLQEELGPEFPSYDPDSYEHWQIDVRSCDLRKYDLSDREYDLMHANYDSNTIWPDPLPFAFDPDLIIEMGKDPGLNISTLHDQNIKGQGIGVAIIDNPLLVDHTEYYDRVQLYEEINFASADPADMHGCTTTSIAVGKNTGVAPEAKLYFIAVDRYDPSEGEQNFAYSAQAIDRILEINEQLPEEEKIRVISMSHGWGSNSLGFIEIEAAVRRAMNAGIYVVTACHHLHYYYDSYGLGRDPDKDPNMISSYGYPMWVKNNWMFELPDKILTPMDSLTVASPIGTDAYTFYREGGESWTIPYIAGVYALACQVNPNITPQIFEDIMYNTAIPIEAEWDNIIMPIGRVINPTGIMDVLENSLTESDTIAPTITITNPITNNIYHNYQLLVEYSISEPVTRTIYIDNQLYNGPLRNNTVLDFSEGSHEITIIATDLAGNIGRAEVIFTVDMLPMIEITSPTATPHLGGMVDLYYELYHADTLELYLDDELQEMEISNGMTIHSSGYGTHNITLIAYDNQGNMVKDTVIFSTNPFRYGDVNADGEVDIVDALLTAQYYVYLDPEDFIVPEAADVNDDDYIDIIDAFLIAQYYAGIIIEFPIEIIWPV